MKPTVIMSIIFVLNPVPALACHHYARWYYPWKQSCFPHKTTYRVAYRAPAPKEDKTWYVEVMPIPNVPVPENLDPPKEQRTEDQIEDQAAHDEVVKQNKDELNAQLKTLKEEEGKKLGKNQ